MPQARATAPLACGVAAALATFPAFGFAILAWARGFWSLRSRVHYTLVAAAALGLLLVAHEWSLIGFRY